MELAVIVPMLLANCATVWFFCKWLPERYDVRQPGATPDAPGLIPYTEGMQDTIGMV